MISEVSREAAENTPPRASWYLQNERDCTELLLVARFRQEH